MSLAVLADHMASKGRGPDSMLIHMSPREVQGLQALAMEHGGSLTINPHTGLPEAGFLDKLLPSIIGFGISAASGGTIDPMTAAALVGGVQTARTGDIGKGISAGLGAYGGATLGAGMSSAGSSVLGTEAGALAGNEAAAWGTTQLTDAGANVYSQAQLDALKRAAIDEGALQQGMSELTGKTTTGELLSKGFDVAKSNPMQYLKANAMPLAMAAGPAILAGMSAKQNMPKTVTNPGMIAPYTYDPYGGSYTAGLPYKAASGGIMGFDESSNSPMSRRNLEGMGNKDSMFNYAHDGGGVMKMAEGGLGSIAHFAAGGDAALEAYQAGNYEEANRLLGAAGMSAQDVVSKYGLSQADAATVAKNLGYTGDMSGLQYAAPPAVQAAAPVVQAAAAPVVQAAEAPVAQAAAAAPAYTQYTNEQIGSYLSNPVNKDINIQDAIKATNADPTAVNAYIASLTKPFVGSTDTTGGSGTLGIYNQMLAQGVDPNEYYAAATANDPKYAGWSKEDITRGYKLDEGAYALSKQLKGVVSDKDWAKFMDDNKYSINDMSQAFGLSRDEVTRRYNAAKATQPVVCGAGFKLSADGKSCVPDKQGPITCGPGYKLSVDGKSCVRDTTVVTEDTTCPSGSHWDPNLKMCVLNTSATQNTTDTVTTPTSLVTTAANTLPVGVSGTTGPSIFGGGATVNPNGTITTSPVIPGIPVGGFTGMEQVRDAYTKGGGSLGYVPYAPKTMDEFDKKYASKLTGGSKQAYDYLTGKTKYSPTPDTPTGEVMKPYSESVLGMPANLSKKMYLFDPATKQYKINPDYAIPTRDPKTGKSTTTLTNRDVTDYVAKAPSYNALYSWMTTNNLSPEQVATATGKPITEINKQFLKAQGIAGDDGKIDQTKLDEQELTDQKANFDATAYLKANPDVQAELDAGKANFGDKSDLAAAAWEHYQRYGKAGGRAYTKKAAEGGLAALTMARGGSTHPPFFSKTTGKFNLHAPQVYGDGGMAAGGQFDLGSYSDGGRLLRGPGDGVSDSIPATIGNKRPARLADGEFVVPARIVSELGNGSTEAGARKLYAMMDRVQSARRSTVGKGRVAKNSRSEKYLPA
jgi:hypothetical protein